MHNEEHKTGSIKLPNYSIQNLKKYYFLFIAILLFSLSSKSTNTTQNLENPSYFIIISIKIINDFNFTVSWNFKYLYVIFFI